MTALDVIAVDYPSIIELIAAAAATAQDGRSEDAMELYEQWLRNNPADPFRHVACFNHGVLLFECGHFADAVAAYSEAIRIEPNFLASYINAGLALERLARLDQAAEQWLHVANLVAPVDRACLSNKAAALRHLGRLFERVRNYSRAEEALQRCLEIDPHQADIIQHWTGLRQMQCKWPVVEPFATLTRPILTASLSPLGVAIHTDDPMFQLANAWRHACTAGAEAPAIHTAGRWIAPTAPRQRPLRIGYVSPDLRGHAVGFLTVELFELHDRAKVEVFAYYAGRTEPDAVQARIRQATDHWRDIAGWDATQAARLIVQDEIDILIDLGGHTNEAPAAALALRPAPVIVNWLGYPGSMGTPHHQYIIADAEVIPPSHEKYYTERVVRLPCYQPTDRRRIVGAPPPSREQVGLAEDAMVYCCFNGAQKITPEIFQCWMDILTRVPHSVLWLLSCDAATDERLRCQAAGHGVSPERLVFAVRQPNTEHLARYHLADLFLDTAPYGAHTTASDALWMGVPVLAIAGQSFPSRVCASLVRAAGLTELVCDNLTRYGQMAVELGHQPTMRIHLREKLRISRDNCTLFDMPLLVNRLEALYRQMWDDYLSDQLPEPDLTNLGIYHAIATELDGATPNVPDLAVYEQRYVTALAYRDSVSPVPPDCRLWPGRRGPGLADCRDSDPRNGCHRRHARAQSPEVDPSSHVNRSLNQKESERDGVDSTLSRSGRRSTQREGHHMTPFRQAVIDRIWRGRDPLLHVPTNLIQFDLQGWNSQHSYLEEAITTLQPAIVVEIGVWKGGSTVFMADRMKSLGQGGVVIAVDTWLGSSEHWLHDGLHSEMSFMLGYPAMYYKFLSNVQHAGLVDHVVPLPLDSLNAAIVLSALQVRPSVIHVDGGHDYDSVKADLKAWWPLLLPGGLLVGDDYFTNGVWPTVKQAFDDFFGALGTTSIENRDGKCRVQKPPA